MQNIELVLEANVCLLKKVGQVARRGCAISLKVLGLLPCTLVSMSRKWNDVLRLAWLLFRLWSEACLRHWQGIVCAPSQWPQRWLRLHFVATGSYSHW